MSSFRIDRQYVSFVAAETRSVYAAGQMPDEKSFFNNTDDAGTNEHLEEIEQNCAEILEKARKEADEKAALILERARSEADVIERKAKRLADEMLEDARNSAAAIMEDAKQMGYAEGQKNAQAHAEAKKSKEAEEFSHLVEKLRRDYSGLVDALHDEVISLVVNIVKKIINFKLNESDKIFLELVSSAMEQLKQSGTIIIRVGSEDYARYFGKELAEKNIHAGKAKVVVTEEEGFAPGDLVVESEGEILDFSIGRQIERVEKAFRKEGMEQSDADELSELP